MLYSIFYFLMFGSSFIAMQYLNLYYKSIGFSKMEISAIIIISSIVAIASSLFFGYKFDRTKKKHLILYTILIGSLICFSIIALFDNFLSILLINVCFYMFYLSVQPLFTTVTLENIEKNCLSYGKVRLFGTIGFCFFSILLPIIKFENTIFFAMFFVLSCMIIVFTFILKKDKINTDIKEKSSFKIREILAQKDIIIIILYVCFINITLGAYFNFFGIYFTDELGYSKKLYGVICAVSTLSEIPFLLYSPKLFKKYNIKNILVVAGIITGIRWILCAFFTSSIALLFIQLLHGFGFIVLMTSVNVYINNNCNKKYIASTQSLFFISTLVFSKVMGCIIGGLLTNVLEQRYVFVLSSVICLFSTLLFIYFARGNVNGEICN